MDSSETVTVAVMALLVFAAIVVLAPGSLPWRALGATALLTGALVLASGYWTIGT